MALPRSTFYDAPSVAMDDTEIVRRIQAICDEFETYGYRRVGAALRQEGLVVNSKKVRAGAAHMSWRATRASRRGSGLSALRMPGDRTGSRAAPSPPPWSTRARASTRTRGPCCGPGSRCPRRSAG